MLEKLKACFLDWFVSPVRKEGVLQNPLEELRENGEQGELDPTIQEKTLLSNMLNLQNLTADDATIPRADIIAASLQTPVPELIQIFQESKHSKLLVYRETLDDVVGFINIRSLLKYAPDFKGFSYEKEMEQVLFVAPSMRLLDLLLHMRTTRTKLAVVVDEFGGVDGLISISDIIDEIVGGLDDIYAHETQSRLTRMSDGSIVVSARMDIDAFEQEFGKILTEEERQEEDIETLGGLVVSIVGRVPVRKEIIVHASGVEFEILEADPRRVKRLRIYPKGLSPKDKKTDG